MKEKRTTTTVLLVGLININETRLISDKWQTDSTEVDV